MRSILLLLLFHLAIFASAQNYYLFIGSYTGTGSKGIYVYNFNATTGKAVFVSNTEGIVNPSFITIAPAGNFLYACTETRTQNSGSISSFSFNKKTGSLKFINKQSSEGDNPVYVALHKSEKWVVCGNYYGGTLAALRVNKDGSVQKASQVFNFNNPLLKQQQLISRVHSTVFSPDHKTLVVPDLGLDKIYNYKFLPYLEKPLSLDSSAIVSTIKGRGPRHFVFHPSKKFGYVTEELSGSVEVYKYNKGRLDSIQHIFTHSDTASGPFSTADLHISPDGKFLYVSNRAKENNIAIFSINQSSGKVKLIGFQPTMGEVPRNFIIDPTGNFLLVANQQSGNITFFKRNLQTGLLTPLPDQIKIPEVSCLQMVKM